MEKFLNFKKYFTPKTIALILIISLIFNAALVLLKTNPAVKNPDFEDLAEKYPYLSKRILQEDQNDYLINLLPLRKQLRETVAPYQNDLAFYFEYLPTGSSIGINEKAEFSAASLIKVPIVMAYYHYMERLKLEDSPRARLKITDIDNSFGELGKKGVGAEITLEEAARLALTASDNTAALVLAHNVPQEDFEDVYQGLDIDFKKIDEEVIITAKQYSSILKALYFSAVLEKENSQKILELLTKTHFQDKLKAGVPQNVTVANKFGILGNALFQDCGIVYVPRRPYILCIVSKSDETIAKARMKNISNIIYSYVSAYNPGK